MELIIHSGTVITMKDGRVIRDGAVVVEGQAIVDVGETSEILRKYPRGYERINARGKVVVPGLINTHQHAAMSLLRGYADDLPLQEWLEKWIWPIEGHMTAHDIYVGALLTAVESALGGTTTVNTMYHYTPDENEAKAFVDVGLRAVVGHVCFSWRKEGDKNALEDLAKNWHNKADGLVRVSVDPHAPYTVDPEYMRELKELCGELNEKYGSEKAPIIWHVHVAETSDEPEKIRRAFNKNLKGGVMEYLDSLGVLDSRVVAAHCVALTDNDIAVMKLRGVKASHNPISNLKLASGISPVPKMLEQGVTVSLGTDSPCSNNSADMFEVMKVAALLHKGVNRNPTLISAAQVLNMATVEGARALSWDSEIGSIEVGKKADLAIIGFVKPHLCPVHNEVSHLVYAAKATDVETVIVNGKIVVENRQLKTVKGERVMKMAEKAKTRLLERLKSNVK
ncbi:MAG: amidohydrolase [Candidatus Bathyarchaeota archaeon]|nr:amidohydrolase [Candidatus Bathyarchaeota archaeon]MDW8040183.1 amidohydrolase [Nitrososphaerota archaeon]